MEINLNDACSVVLTQAGADILNNIQEKLWMAYGYKPRCIHLCGETYKTQLWSLMQDFGQKISMTLPVPFERLKITMIDGQYK